MTRIAPPKDTKTQRQIGSRVGNCVEQRLPLSLTQSTTTPPDHIRGQGEGSQLNKINDHLLLCLYRHETVAWSRKVNTLSDKSKASDICPPSTMGTVVIRTYRGQLWGSSHTFGSRPQSRKALSARHHVDFSIRPHHMRWEMEYIEATYCYTMTSFSAWYAIIQPAVQLRTRARAKMFRKEAILNGIHKIFVLRSTTSHSLCPEALNWLQFCGKLNLAKLEFVHAVVAFGRAGETNSIWAMDLLWEQEVVVRNNGNYCLCSQMKGIVGERNLHFSKKAIFFIAWLAISFAQ